MTDIQSTLKTRVLNFGDRMSALFPTLRNPPELGWDLPNLILKGPINPKYFQPETWAGLVKNDLGRQQFTKFIKNMVERMWSQAGTTDEVRAFADLLGDEGEWDLLSIGLTALKRVGAYDRKGQVFAQSFDEPCLLRLLMVILADLAIRTISNAAFSGTESMK